MNKEDKELLLKDLCARLPYGTLVYAQNADDWYDDEISTQVLSDSINEDYVIKPYLFPLSSMTEEQRNDISKLLIDTQKEYSPYGELNMMGCDNLFICTVKQANVLINYCLSHHLDINGLIEKSLALDATNLGIYE